MSPKPGSRAIGIAASDGPTRSQLCGAVVRADRVVEDLFFTQCTVGGIDATNRICELLEQLERPDVRWLLLSGVAPAWFNLIDLDAVYEAADRPVIAVSFESSEGLEDPLAEHFSGKELEMRRSRYRQLPEQHLIDVGSETLSVRTVGIDIESASGVLTAFTPEASGRPEPLRVARLAARAARRQIEALETAVDGEEKTES